MILRTLIHSMKVNNIFKLAEINNQAYTFSSNIEALEKALSEEKEETAKFQREYEKREEEFINISKEIEKLQSMYENKVELLTNKISELKQDNKAKVEKLSESGNFLNYNTNLIKSLKSQIDMKNEELMNSKRDFEALLELKNKKIGELQSSLKSKTKYPTKFSSQIDEEIKGLMKKLNLSAADTPVNDK
jgi:chromosome segregation ATPase